MVVTINGFEHGWPIRAIMAGLLAAGCTPADARASAPADLLQPRAAQVAPRAAADTLGTLEVSGTASVKVPADRARASFAVETEAATAQAASAENAERMDAVIQALRGAGIAGVTVETSGYTVRPRYTRQPPAQLQERRIEGYTAVNSVQVILEDVEAIGRLIDAAIGAGANRVASVDFYAADTESARLRALREAVSKARAEAEAIAEAMDARLGPALRVRTDAPRPGIPMRGAFELAQAVATPVAPGEQTVTATVTITYRLEGR